LGVGENDVELAQSGWIRDQIDPDDPLVLNREAKQDSKLPARHPHRRGNTIDECRHRAMGALQELRDSRSAMTLLRGP
jgi:hypothetical protein